ncbi:hypothetical protein BRYFOR_09191 [Marvinbryantia formatexigens DSM 14469]|uniref:Uncharacterized protein n=1 Tax=Marvinbryantia formatexigens DSM 14469 TaxID=478749 RepID=C6LKK3_9FIRM|nr:hypothetical protein BRYFOR_09191 [Marvinbryantia formatexigens DSM 14469]
MTGKTDIHTHKFTRKIRIPEGYAHSYTWRFSFISGARGGYSQIHSPY